MKISSSQERLTILNGASLLKAQLFIIAQKLFLEIRSLACNFIKKESLAQLFSCGFC